MKSITTAIEYLPEELVTPEIVAAALKESDVKLLNFLPQRFLTEENISTLVENDKSYWGHFDLEKIPLSCRSQAVCICAVKKFRDNYRHVPGEFKTPAMLDGLMDNVHNSFYLLEFVPGEHWNRESIYKGISRLYRESGNSHSYGRSTSYSSYTGNSDRTLKQVQVLLSFVPRSVPDRSFYHGLFRLEALPAKDAAFLTPAKYRNNHFYLLLAQKDFSLVPEKKYSYGIFMAALDERGRLSPSDIFEKQHIREAALPLMDNAMADALVRKGAQSFSQLPGSFQTAERLLLTVESHPDCRYFHSMIKSPSLLTEEVCKALVKSGHELPEFPESIWNEPFIAFCVENPGSYEWFKQMPKHFQTQETVNAAVKYWEYNVRYAHPAFISSRLAMELFRRDGKVKKYLPEKYFIDFVQTTGLPEEFFGGETTFMNLKENRPHYSYCQTGNTFIGYCTDGRYSNAASFVILTRASSGGGQPQAVFNRRVGSFHKTWLEKMIADYDRDFVKPTVDKALKDVQPNLYCGVETAGVKDGVELFRITFRGETIAFAGRKGGEVLHRETREEVVAGFQASNAA
jgi:hypothetical protein